MLTYSRLSQIPLYPATRPIRVTEPTLLQEPISIERARHQVGLDAANGYHDEDLKEDIATARQHVEHDTGVVCYAGSFVWNFTDFPPRDWIEISGVRPVTSLTSIVYVDTAGNTQTFSASAYTLVNTSLVPLIRLNYGQVWPFIRGDIGGITVTLVAGYASVAVVPANVKAAARLKLHELWKLRMGDDASKTVEGYERLVNLIRREDYA